MPKSIVQFKTNVPSFNDFVKRYAAGAMLTFEEAFVAQGRMLCDRLMKLTPPLSGKSIKRGLWNRELAGMAGYKRALLADNKQDMKAAFEQFAPFRDDEIEDMSAKQVGERRVQKDISRVIKGVHGAVMPTKENPLVIVSQTNPRAANHDIQIDWGVRQKCQGRDAIRIYADRSGYVYGVDAEKFLPNPSSEQLAKVHESHRGKRGRVTTAGKADLVVGRWRWLNIVVAPWTAVDAYIEKKKAMVGQAKGGWAAGFAKLGGKISTKGWVGRHMGAGTFSGGADGGVVNITITNNSAWASNGDPDRILENAMEGRQRDMEKGLAVILEKRWDQGAATFDKTTGRTTL